jgi:hypothetical protein
VHVLTSRRRTCAWPREKEGKPWKPVASKNVCARIKYRDKRVTKKLLGACRRVESSGCVRVVLPSNAQWSSALVVVVAEAASALTE